MTQALAGFAACIVRWQSAHGRNNLPWQNTRDPYRVWVAEIMLQQTQVATAQPYYERFLLRFASVELLAQASQDEVLGLWSGLGYYSRARNLHRCAQDVVQVWGGVFPLTARELQTLPGIGRSTAAAIAAFCYGERVAILDGNVKRVLARVLGFDADIGVGVNQERLWQQAQGLLPQRALLDTMPRYTQGLMDLGASLCARQQPSCGSCPVRSMCEAFRQGRPQAFPVKTRKIKRSTELLWLLWVHDADGRLWLQRRPQSGIWAGLHCLPAFADEASCVQALPEHYRQHFKVLPVVHHTLTHKDLRLHPIRVKLPRGSTLQAHGGWIALDQWPVLGLPAPVRALLQSSEQSAKPHGGISEQI